MKFNLEKYNGLNSMGKRLYLNNFSNILGLNSNKLWDTTSLTDNNFTTSLIPEIDEPEYPRYRDPNIPVPNNLRNKIRPGSLLLNKSEECSCCKRYHK